MEVSEMGKYLTDEQDARIIDVIFEETQKAAYEEQCFQHQGSSNENYFEEMNDYLDGTMEV